MQEPGTKRKLCYWFTQQKVTLGTLINWMLTTQGYTPSRKRTVPLDQPSLLLMRLVTWHNPQVRDQCPDTAGNELRHVALIRAIQRNMRKKHR